MGAVLLIFAICVLNVCLGYALAVHLEYAPPGLWEAWEALAMDPPVCDAAAPKVAETPAKVEAPQQREEKRIEDPVLVSVLRFKQTLAEDTVNLRRIDALLRKDVESWDAAEIRQHVAELKETCDEYLGSQEVSSNEFNERTEKLAEMKGLVADVEMALLEQTAQVETTLNNLDHIDFTSDLATAQDRLLNEVDNLRCAGHKLADCLDAGFLAIARYRCRLGNIENRLQGDPLTGLPNRIWLEKNLETWWKEGRQRTGTVSVALFDLQDFGRINQGYGPVLGDRILREFGRILPAAIDQQSVAARFGGQVFIVVMFDVNCETAKRSAEGIRDAMEGLSFIRHGEEIRLAVTCGWTEAAPEDTPNRFLKKVDKELLRAKGSQSWRKPSAGEPSEQVDLSEAESAAG